MNPRLWWQGWHWGKAVRHFRRQRLRLVLRHRGIWYFGSSQGGPPVAVSHFLGFWKTSEEMPWVRVTGPEGQWWIGQRAGTLVLLGCGLCPDLLIAQKNWVRCMRSRRGIVALDLPHAEPVQVEPLSRAVHKKGSAFTRRTSP